MIVKINGVKASSSGAVKRLLEYIAGDKGRIDKHTDQAIFHNIISTDLTRIEEELHQNYHQYGRKRKDGNIVHHLIISGSPLDRDKLSLEIMDDVTREYVTKAFPEALAFGCHHLHEEHIHTHILVSANSLLSPKATRQTKRELHDNHQRLLDYIKTNYPQLHIGFEKRAWRTPHPSIQNSSPLLSKEELTTRIQNIFRESESTIDFHKKLQSNEFEIYQHQGNPFGVMNGSQKIRFSRLGLTEEHFKQLDTQHQRLTELSQLRDSSSKDREIDER